MNISFSNLKYLHGKLVLFTGTGLIMVSCSGPGKDLYIISAPAASRYTSINKDGVTVIPNGRLNCYSKWETSDT